MQINFSMRKKAIYFAFLSNTQKLLMTSFDKHTIVFVYNFFRSKYTEIFTIRMCRIKKVKTQNSHSKFYKFFYTIQKPTKIGNFPK